MGSCVLTLVAFLCFLCVCVLKNKSLTPRLLPGVSAIMIDTKVGACAEVTHMPRPGED